MLAKMELWKRLKRHIQADSTTSCWTWTGATSDGYGQIRIEQKLYLTHRLMLFIKNGKWPNQTDHQCRNRACCNPNSGHIEDVTHAINNRRMWAVKGKKTHCKRGHELISTNISVGKNGARTCKLCKNSRRKNWLSTITH